MENHKFDRTAGAWIPKIMPHSSKTYIYNAHKPFPFIEPRDRARVELFELFVYSS